MARPQPIGTNPWRGSPIPFGRVKWAIESTISMGDAARALNVTYNTFKKYAKMYKLFAPIKNIGIRPRGVGRKKMVKLVDILDGKYPMLPPLEIQEMLIKSGSKIQECEICGFDRYRPDDLTSPLIIDFIDGNIRNHKFSNMRIICYNCFYITHGIKPPKVIPKVKLGIFRKQLITAFDDDNVTSSPLITSSSNSLL